MRKQLMIPALLAMSVALAACSTPPNANLENARTNFSALQANPNATKVAALETKDAQDWLDKADKAYRDKEDQKKVDQLAYLTNQRVEVAKDTITLRESEAKLKNAGDERARALLDARDAQIKQLQDSLNAKQTDRGTLVTFGDVLFATNKSDLKSSGLVNITKLAQFQQGVDISRIVTQGYGKEYPVADNGSVSGRAMNRRVEVTISNDNQPVKPRSSMAN
ncbi:hypothetical protein AO262_19190 [Pseudomonas fluorescens ABAC62]|nr:hypothetical protein AO262_19190 [Pseudomonas fluorescens ABAC62]